MNDQFKRLILRAGWAPGCVVLLHLFRSMLYGPNVFIDYIFHFVGGFAIAYFLNQAVLIFKNWFGNPRALGRTLIVFCAATTAAVFWEFFEFFVASVFDVYAQISIKETMYDLFCGCLGATSFLTIKGILTIVWGRAKTTYCN